jgi:thiol-disulfide isomerase/thioredoxin
MDVSLPDRPLRRIAWGAFEGANLGGLVYAITVLMGGIVAGPSWRGALEFVGVGILVCAAGHYIARGILGACVGLIGGALLGSMMGDDFSRPTLVKHHLNRPAELSGITLEGKRYDIASRRGKVVLVDFWATWCPRCREELQRLKKLYERYHDDGLEIVGVSLDDQKNKLADFVEREGIPWPQIYTDTPGEQGWENPLLYQYVIRAIPYTLLVDRRGTIVASGLLGTRLEEAVTKVMAGEKPPERWMTGLEEPVTLYLAVIGCLAGMLVERRLRQVWSRPRLEISS